MNYLRCVCGLEMSARCATWTADADVRKRRAISSPAGAGAMPIPLVWRHAAVSVAAVSMSRTRCFSRAASTGRQTARQRNTAISTRISGRHVTVAELVMPAHAARSFVAMAIARAMGTTEPPSEGTTETVSAAAASAASTYPETASRACAKVCQRGPKALAQSGDCHCPRARQRPRPRLLPQLRRRQRIRPQTRQRQLLFHRSISIFQSRLDTLATYRFPYSPCLPAKRQ